MWRAHLLFLWDPVFLEGPQSHFRLFRQEGLDLHCALRKRCHLVINHNAPLPPDISFFLYCGWLILCQSLNRQRYTHYVGQLKKKLKRNTQKSVLIGKAHDMFGKCRIHLNLSSQRTNDKKEIGENSSLIPYKNTN